MKSEDLFAALVLLPLKILFLFLGVTSGVVFASITLIGLICILTFALMTLAATAAIATIPGIPLAIAFAGDWLISEISENLNKEDDPK